MPSSQPSPWQIRDLMPKDINTDFSFYETLEALAPVGDVCIGWMKTIFARRKNRGIHTLVAVEGGKVIGTASLIVEPKFLHGCKNAGHLEDVAVHKDHQGRGVGKALVEACIERAKKAKCYKLTLDCQPGNVAFYEKLNFKLSEHQMRIDL